MSSWTEKDQRLFEQMKEGGRRRMRVADPSLGDEGMPVRRRTISSRLLEERTLDELYLRARELEIAGRSRMTKDQLVAAIRRKN